MLFLTILVSNISCDQISKAIVREKISANEHIGLLNNYLTLTKIENSGAFLSTGSMLPQPLKMVLLTILPVLVLGLVVIFLMTKRNLSNLAALGLCFIAGGGFGNIYDRIVYGSVTDFVHIDFVIFQTGIFNMADVSIMTGVFIVCMEPLLKRKRWLREN